MPEKWNDASEKKLLLEVIAASNPSLPTAVWARIATAMGETYTMEACRQKYQGIKRNLKPSDSTPTKNTNGSKPKTPTSATKSRKRKAAKDAANHSDDDEPSTLFAPHATSPALKKQKMKKEPSDYSNGAIGAEVFKAEHAGAEGGIDLERDELYENDAAAAV